MVDAAIKCRRFQRLRSFGREVAVVLVHVDARADPVGVEFGVKLHGIDVVADAESLDRTVGRVGEAGQVLGQRAGPFLVAAISVENVGEFGEQRIPAPLLCEGDGQGPDRLGVGPVDGSADN